MDLQPAAQRRRDLDLGRLATRDGHLEEPVFPLLVRNVVQPHAVGGPGVPEPAAENGAKSSRSGLMLVIRGGGTGRRNQAPAASSRTLAAAAVSQSQRRRRPAATTATGWLAAPDVVATCSRSRSTSSSFAVW